MFRAFSVKRGGIDFDGLYFWRDRPSAEAWFNLARFEHLRRERGVAARARIFDDPMLVDNIAGGTPADGNGRAVRTLVERPIPAGVTRERLAEELRAAVARGAELIVPARSSSWSEAACGASRCLGRNRIVWQSPAALAPAPPQSP